MLARVTLYIALALLVDGAAGLSGGLLSERWLSRHLPALVGFAAGAILAAVFLDVLPEAVSGLGARALVLALVGFVALAVIESLAGPGHHHHGEPHHAESQPPALPAALLAAD